ncbi:hypothetical protein P9112_011473 [Eukaryota sp. TZLM1-RC]
MRKPTGTKMSSPAPARSTPTNPPPPSSPKKQCIKEANLASDPNVRFRAHMEDSHCLEDTFSSNRDAFYAIFDGHGGREAADQIAVNFPSIFRQHLASSSLNHIEEVWFKTYRDVDGKLDEQAMQFQGAAAVATYIHCNEDGSKTVYASNLGDARAVIYTDKTTTRLTKDHKASDRGEIERITGLGGFVIASRVQGILSVSRALGDHGLKPYVSVEPYVYSHTCTAEAMQSSDPSFLIIACDGLWDIFNDQDAVNIAREELTKKESPEPLSKRMAERLLGSALQGGSTDNISIIVVIL